jgi:hypothetical protein
MRLCTFTALAALTVAVAASPAQAGDCVNGSYDPLVIGGYGGDYAYPGYGGTGYDIGAFRRRYVVQEYHGTKPTPDVQTSITFQPSAPPVFIRIP